jgi:hypothetical protein
LIKYGEKIFNFFHKLNPAISTMVILLGPLAMMLGRAKLIFLGIVLALEDIDGYVNGKDSVIGRFINYMKDLTGMDLTGLAVGFGVLGIAILAAFAPVTALMVTVGALIGYYEYLQKIKSREGVNPESNSLPTYDQMNSQAKKNVSDNWDKASGFWGKTKAGASLAWEYGKIGNSGDALINWEAIKGAHPENRALVARLSKFRNEGIVSAEEQERALTAIGGGYSKASAISQWLDQRTTYNPNISTPWKEAKAFQIGVVNVVANDVDHFKKSLMEAVPNFAAPFSQPTP